jgi:RNA polymerase sigma factor (TIGR02999 family)
VERARRKRTQKHGGGWHRLELADVDPAAEKSTTDVLALNEALLKLEATDVRKATLVKLRYFAGLTIEQAAHALGVSTSTADNDWAYAKSWLRLEMGKDLNRD